MNEKDWEDEINERFSESKYGPRYFLQDENGEPYPVKMLEWARWFETHKHHIAHDRVGDYDISTIFLGLDHGWGFADDETEYKPVLWETLAFLVVPRENMSDDEREHFERYHRLSIDDTMVRYTSRAAALKGHKRIMAVCARRMQEDEAIEAKRKGK